MKKVISNMAGNVWKILVQPGEHVEEGQHVVILESMKMEIHVASETSGTVKEVKIQEGEFVNEGDELLELE